MTYTLTNDIDWVPEYRHPASELSDRLTRPCYAAVCGCGRVVTVPVTTGANADESGRRVRCAECGQTNYCREVCVAPDARQQEGSA